MRSFFSLAIVSFWLMCLAPAPAAPGANVQERAETFRVEGAVEKTGDWSKARLEKEFAADLKTISYTLKGEKGEARCLPLLSFLQYAKPRLNAKVKNHLLAFVAIVQADDGYTVAFSLGELLPANGKREVWLALDRNGKPLSREEGPVQLLVPEDEKPSRWVHGVSRILVLDGFQTLGKVRR